MRAQELCHSDIGKTIQIMEDERLVTLVLSYFVMKKSLVLIHGEMDGEEMVLVARAKDRIGIYYR